jgi:deoxyribose-phosphate aldolase
MALRLEELAKTIDHTLQEPDPVPADVVGLCEEACEHHFAAVCVEPRFVRLASERLRGCDVKVAGVVVAWSRKEKVAQAAACVAAGAAEIELALDTEALGAGAFRAARAELAALIGAVRMAGVNTGRESALVKVAIDCDRLDQARKRLACAILEDADADFATARASASGSAVLYDLEFLRDRLPETIGLKAAVPVARIAAAEELVIAGAARIATPHAVAMLRPEPVLSGVAPA